MAPFFGSTDFDQGFYSIPAVESEVRDQDKLHNWRFFAKKKSESEFQIRFPSAKCIDELPHFGGFIMRTKPEVMIEIKKWSGDIMPKTFLEEAWFRIKGIPMNFRCKSVIFYVAGLAGKPLALDKNSIRNFNFVRVKLGCRDVAMVATTREAELGNGLYDFQYSRELFEPSVDPFLRYGDAAAVENAEGDSSQRDADERVSRENSSLGNENVSGSRPVGPQNNQSSGAGHQRFTTVQSENLDESRNDGGRGKSVAQSVSEVGQSSSTSDSSMSFGARMNQIFYGNNRGTGDSFRARSQGGINSLMLQGFRNQRVVIEDATVAEKQGLLTADDGFGNFVRKLTNSSSEKVPSLRQKYGSMLDTIVEDGEKSDDIEKEGESSATSARNSQEDEMDVEDGDFPQDLVSELLLWRMCQR